jgi:hypothetical protein
MYAVFLMRSVLSVLSAVFGGVGVFFAVYSFSSPGLGMYAALCLVIAGGMSYILGADRST